MSNAAPKSAAMTVLRRLRKAGFQALWAGGCVRDMLLGLRSSDYDVATDATPEQVRKLFGHVLLVGAKFGVAMVVFGKRKVEVTTFRSDLSYEDGRRPTGVKFSSPREDAQRRDFTINGMFFDPVGGEVIDYVGGRRDLAAKVLRTIGSPEERFGEDYLRMIRAVRFAVRLGFAIDPPTAEAIGRHTPRIASISGERIYEELSKMLARPSAAEALRKLAELGLAQVILPELFEGGEHPQAEKNPLEGGTQPHRGLTPPATLFRPLGPEKESVPEWEESLSAESHPVFWPRAVERVAAVAGSGDVVLAMAAMLAELPVKQIHAITRRWGASNDVREGLSWMAEHLDDWRTAGCDMGVSRGEGVPPVVVERKQGRNASARHGFATANLAFGRQDAHATHGPAAPATMPLHDLKRLMAHPQFPRLRRLWRVAERMEAGAQAQARALARRIATIAPERIAPAPLVTGDDLKGLGLGEGPRLGKILRALYDAQLDERLTGRTVAMDEARRLAAEPRDPKHQ